MGSVYSEHIEDNDILLTHVFFGDVTRFFVQEVQGGEAGDFVRRILAISENALEFGSTEVQELISVSFVENLVEYDDVLDIITPQLGSKFKKELEAYRA